MTSFRLLKPGVTSIFITLFMTLQISACSTEDFAEAVAGNIISDTSSSSVTTNNTEVVADTIISDTSRSSDTSNSSEADADNIITDTSSSSDTSNSSEAENEPAPAPTAAVAMYSYYANLSEAQALSGAVLEQTTVYMFFDNADQYSSIRFYCCKEDGTVEEHNPEVSDSSAPFVYSVDLSQYGTTGTRELYVDATHADGSGYDSLNFNFSINITIEPGTSTTEPEPAPAPEPTEPVATVYSDVNLSWRAPFEREDNNVLKPAEIAGYKIYYGTTAGNYTKTVNVNDGSIDSYTLKNIPEGTYYFVMTTRDTGGRESRYSTEVTIIASSQ